MDFVYLAYTKVAGVSTKPNIVCSVKGVKGEPRNCLEKRRGVREKENYKSLNVDWNQIKRKRKEIQCM